MTRIVLHIDRLVLHGIDSADAEALSAGVHQALSQSLRETANVAALLAQDRTARVSIGQVQTGTTPEVTGQRIGERIAGGSR